jgi:hypothetical protein
LDAMVEYKAVDSMRFDIALQKVFLFGEANVLYEKIALSANYIELDLQNKTVFATGTKDSLDNLVGKPLFADGGQEFTSETMLYNFDTKKGKITNAITQEGDGYIHGKEIKMVNEDVVFIKKGKYTTCDLDDPHFHIEASKLKIIKNDKIITGPAYLAIENVPTPLVLPFGFFPNKEGKSNGIVIPTYGQHDGLGIFLQDGGYYFTVGDYVDVALLGDVYSRGSWGTKLNSNYKVKYKFNGRFNAEFTKIREGEPGFSYVNSDGTIGTYPIISNNFFVKWKHSQDSKARPGVSFSADVNLGSQNNFKNNLNSSTGNYLTNRFSSNIAYSKRFANNPFNYSINARHEQNNLDSSIFVTFPEVAVGMNRITPFARRVKVGKSKWYEKIGVSYLGKYRNQVKTTQEILFNNFNDAIPLMKNGFQHSIPITTQLKLLKYVSVNPSLTLGSRWYLKTEERTWDNDLVYDEDTNTWISDSLKSVIINDVNQFSATLEGTAGVSATTKIYGMYMFKSQKVKAIRHVLTPSVGFNYTPDYSNEKFGIYKSYISDNNDDNPLNNDTTQYSIYQNGIFSYPGNTKQNGIVSFKLRNNIEMKVASKKDTLTGEKKIKLIEILDFGSNYDMFKDSINWSPITISGSNNLGKGVSLRFNTTWDPYAIDSVETFSESGVYNDVKYNTSHFNETGNFLRFTGFSTNVNFNLKSKNDKGKKESKTGTEEELEHIINNPGAYVDFNIPWSLNLGYSFSYIKRFYDPIIQNTIDVSGDVRITDNWKVGFRTGYEFIKKEITYTTLNINRDLHCWELSANLVPFGQRKSYTITLRVKSSVLQDLKLNRTRQSQYNPNF